MFQRAKGDGAETWGGGVISFTSVGGNGVKYSLFHRPLGGVGPKQHSPISALTLN